MNMTLIVLPVKSPVSFVYSLDHQQNVMKNNNKKKQDSELSLNTVDSEIFV